MSHVLQGRRAAAHLDLHGSVLPNGPTLGTKTIRAVHVCGCRVHPAFVVDNRNSWWYDVTGTEKYCSLSCVEHVCANPSGMRKMRIVTFLVHVKI